MSNVNQLMEIKAKIEAMKKEKEAKANNVAPAMKNIQTVVDKFFPPSEGQIKTYMQLCAQKGQQIDITYRTWDGRKNGEMDKEIKRLLQLPTIKRPSQSQIDLLNEICTRNNWEVPAYANLTGGREGTMSALLNELMQLEKEAQRLAPLSEEQKERILEMYFCPDVDFADLHDSYGINYMNIDGKTWWSRTSQEDIAKTISDLVTYQEASDFMRKYQVVFYKWKTTRLTDGQMARIIKLQESCGMTPMEHYQLLQFDKNTANLYINSTELVYRDRDVVKFNKEALMDDSTARSIKDIDKLTKEQQKARMDVIHALYAMMGMSGRDESETLLDLTESDELIYDLARTVVDVCGVQSVFEILITCYELEDVKKMLNISDDKDECELAEQEILSAIETFTASNIAEEQAFLAETYSKKAQEYYDEALISEEVFEIAKEIFNL